MKRWETWPEPPALRFHLCTRCGIEIRPTSKRRMCRDCFDVERKAA